jgi:hypothetical protein
MPGAIHRATVLCCVAFLLATHPVDAKKKKKKKVSDRLADVLPLRLEAGHSNSSGARTAAGQGPHVCQFRQGLGYQLRRVRCSARPATHVPLLPIGCPRRESDEEFRERLLGSKAPQLQRIVTGVDPRLADEEDTPGYAPGTRLEKLADDELSLEDREAKRDQELWKLGNKAKEFGYKWKVSTHQHLPRAHRAPQL